MDLGFWLMGSPWITHWRASYFLFFFTFSVSSTTLAFVPPSSKCYALDKDYHLHDFTHAVGHTLEHKADDGGDFVIRFCKDVQHRNSKGYVNYGRFVPELFLASDSAHFTQEFTEGDLQGCEHNAYDLTGRNSQVKIICGTCPGSSSCADQVGCICNVTSSSCRSNIVLAVECGQPGPRVLKGFTVGYTPRGKELVENGITQWGYDKFHDDYSFATEQRALSLYFTAPTQFSKFVKKPSFLVKPTKGLSVKLSGSAASGVAPTTESPTVLNVEWQCDKTAGGPFLVSVTVPVDGFNPVIFNLGKECEHTQNFNKNTSSGWATFGAICLTVIIIVSCCCCAGFCYNTWFEHKSGLEAVPGLPTVARYLDSASRGAGGDGYRPAEDASAADGPSRTSRPGRTSESKYGTV